MGARVSNAEYLTRAKEVWGDRWDYTSTVYAGSNKSLTVICPTHGDYLQRASSHLNGELACVGCRGVVADTSSLRSKAREVWGNRWDFSNTEYLGSRTKVNVICPLHGIFTQSIPYLLQGRVGCKKCSGQGVTTPDFIARSIKVWGDRWDYSNTEYISNSKPVYFVCKIHGEFSQAPSPHLRGQVGCLACVGRVWDQGSFIERAREVWGNRWGYEETVYKGSKTLLTITCRKHGKFEQIPTSHLRGSVGCSQCSWSITSKGENEVAEFIKGLGFSVHRGRRDILSGKEVDIYVPEKGLAVEFNGVYFHSEQFISPEYHAQKLQIAQSNGVRLLQVWEDEWRVKRPILEEHLKRVLGVSSQAKVSARNTVVAQVQSAQARVFMNTHHIQGFVGSSVYLALMNDGEIVAMACFKKSGDNYTLTRYASSKVVRGGHSKLVTAFEARFQYGRLITFADLCFSSGELYEKTGWVRDAVLPPDYSYLVGGSTREHKFNYRVSRFKRDPKLQYMEGMSESELASLNKLVRVYDAGKVRFIKPHPILKGN